MPHPWVYSAAITPDGKLTLSVEVTDVMNTKGAIEITGQATQVNGALATIDYTVNVTDAQAGDSSDSDQAGRYFVPVEATPNGDHEFTTGEDLTIFVQVSIEWATVLAAADGNAKSTAGDTTTTPLTWGEHKADAHITAGQSLPQTS